MQLAIQVNVLAVNLTENITLLVDFVQKYNFSKQNDSISFFAPQRNFTGYTQMIVADDIGTETVAPTKLYYSDKVRFPTCISPCGCSAARQFASTSCSL
jgi:hypothetical protein